MRGHRPRQFFMRSAEWVSVLYFAGLGVLALAKPLSVRSKIKVLVLGAVGGISTLVMPFAPAVVRNWVPVALIALAYWQSGCFFQGPNAKVQSVFDEWERRILLTLGMRPGQCPQTPFTVLLELMYVLCYPVVPLGIGALYMAQMAGHAGEYWLIVLLSCYPCYLLLLFIPMLPPRLVEGVDRSFPPGRLRKFNLWLVRRVTHGANTFPSGHVAASAAIALALLRFAPLWGLVFVLIAAGIALGCIAGRYHYVLDVIAALLLAMLVFSAVTFIG